MDFVAVLAREFSLRPEQVRAVIELLDAGNTVPFIARYRKEATGSLDDQLLRELTERLEYLRSLDKRRMEIEKYLSIRRNPLIIRRPVLVVLSDALWVEITLSTMFL